MMQVTCRIGLVAFLVTFLALVSVTGWAASGWPRHRY
jgi:hypothetical protein